MIDITEAELAKRLGNKNNILRGTVQRNSPAYRMDGDKTVGTAVKVPPSLFPIVGALHKLAGAKAAAEEFGITQHRAKDIGNARDCNYIKNEDLAKQISQTIDQARGRAMNRILANLGVMDDDGKYKDLPVADVAAITKDISIIVKNITPPDAKDSGNAIAQVIVMSPSVKPEGQYDIMTVETKSSR